MLSQTSVWRNFDFWLLAAVVLLTGAQAQTSDTLQPPAEFPPASFEGSQYVDSRGCVYVRAGIDGNVTWVPRVNRDRQQVCGMQPTAEAGSAPAQPTQPVAVMPDPAPVQPVATAAAEPVKPQQPQKAAPVAAPTKPARTVAQSPATTTAKRPVAAATPKT